MTLGSLFSGTGGFELAGALNGIRPVWASEIEPYPLKVTALRFPDVQQLGDITKINGAQIPPVDIITFGSPCQNLSVSGDRSGLNGAESSLFFEGIRVIREMLDATDGKYPRYVVWENVNGARSSNKGEDFRRVLEEFARLKKPGVSIPRHEVKGKVVGWKPAGLIVGDGWSVAWRMYDAQYWGVPQRRTRVYALVCLGSERAGEILFKPESGEGYPPACEEIWQRAEPYVAGRVAGTGRETADGLDLVEVHAQDGRCRYAGGVSPTVTKFWGTGGNNTPLVINSSGGGIVATLEKSYAKGLGARNRREREFLYVGGVVRKLTPLEACRLQGFPDWWEDGANGRDAERFRMWGNAVALPCAYDVLNRIANEKIF